ncbi:MAG: MOSC domain-containing protein [Gemmatimonadaceae bacterium]
MSEFDSNRTGERASIRGSVASINISAGGVPKRRVGGAKLSQFGLQGDAQNDKKNHGGPDRAVCVYALDRIQSLQKEGHPIDIGTAGENLTIDGIDWAHVVPGVHLRVGDQVVLEVLSFTNPCKTIKASFTDGKFIRIAQSIHPGWSRVYARVLRDGEIQVGNNVELVSGPE